MEIGSKNHEVVPTSLIAEISAVRGGNVNKALGALAKRDLVARVQNAKCRWRPVGHLAAKLILQMMGTG